ncbi:hypothetical protein ACNKHM_03505 [Shigella sonnei]
MRIINLFLRPERKKMSNRTDLMILLQGLSLQLQGLQKNKNVNSSKMKAVTFYLIMFCDFKFILWIIGERINSRKKSKKNAAERGVWHNLHISCRMRRNADPTT